MKASKLLIKYGGNAMINASLQKQIANVIYQLTQKGHQVCIVHGGGPFINQALHQADIESEFVLGQRKTSPEAMEEIQKTLIGEVNANLVGTFSHAGINAVGLSGLDSGMVRSKAKTLQVETTEGILEKVDLGRVGEITEINPNLVANLLVAGFTPIIACVASNSQGESMNVNADDFAGEMAAALKADYYISLTDVDGLYASYPDPDSIIASLCLKDIPSLYGSTVQGGMIPKVQSCERALRKGVHNVLILNGTKPEKLADFFTKGEITGTTLTH